MATPERLTRAEARRLMQPATLPAVSRGYAEGSAIEERLAALERGDGQPAARKATRAAVYASTPDHPQQHFIGWADDIDAEELFRTGDAWGILILHRGAPE